MAPANSARASVITYLVTGTVTDVINANGGLPTDVANTPLGAAFTFQYTVDTSVSPKVGTQTLAAYDGAVTQASFQVAGGPSLSSSSASLSIFADYFNSSDNYYQTSYSVSTDLGDTTSLTGTVVSGSFSQFLHASSPLNLFSSALAVPDPLSTSLHPNESMGFVYTSYVNGVVDLNRAGAITANVTSIQPIPLPAASSLLLGGLIAFGRRRPLGG